MTSLLRAFLWMFLLALFWMVYVISAVLIGVGIPIMVVDGHWPAWMLLPWLLIAAAFCAFSMVVIPVLSDWLVKRVTSS